MRHGWTNLKKIIMDCNCGFCKVLLFLTFDSLQSAITQQIQNEAWMDKFEEDYNGLQLWFL